MTEQNQKYSDGWMGKLLLKSSDSSLQSAEDMRGFAAERFGQISLPSRKQEIWRYTNLDKLLGDSFSEKEPDAASLDIKNDWKLLADAEDAFAFTFLNGALWKEETTNPDAESCVKYIRFDEKNDTSQIQNIFREFLKDEKNAFAIANSMRFRDLILIHVPEGKVLSKPVYLAMGEAGDSKNPVLSHPRILVVLERNAQANIICHQESLNQSSYLTNSFVAVRLHENSSLNWTQIQKKSASAHHAAAFRGDLSRDASIHYYSYEQGGGVNHQDIEFTLSGDGASASLDGLAILDGKSQSTTHVLANHKGGHGTSRQLVKNILTDEARSEFNSTVHVFEGTSGSDSDQLNRNLILSDNARAFARPQLEIDSDDVKATHGSATGQLSPQEIFYLQSRGFDQESAKQILTHGFAREIASKFGPDALKQKIETLVRTQIDRMVKV